MGRRPPSPFAATIATIVAAVSVAGCAGESETSTTSAPTTTTTTTLPVGGVATEVPTTDPLIEALEDVPETFVVLFDEHYVCQLGLVGESDITSSGTATVNVFPAAEGFEVTGSGSMDAAGFVRAGDICTGEAAGGHRFTLSGVVEEANDGTRTLQLLVTGTWYDTWDGVIECNGGIPPTGPWEWPPEPNVEALTFQPLEHGATWAKEVTMGNCQGTVTRVVDFTVAPPTPTS
jgi:hypothetical protein